MPIRLQLFIGCLIMTLISVALGLFLQSTERDLADLAMRGYDKVFMAMSYAREAQLDYANLVRAYERARSDDGAIDAETLARALKHVHGSLEVAQERATSEASRDKAARLDAEVTETADAVSGGAPTELFRSIDRDFKDLVETYATDGFKFRTGAEKMIVASRTSTYAAIALSVILALVITLALSRAIVPRLKRAVAIASAIAEGRLDNKISARGRSEAAVLLRVLDRMQQAIAENINRIEKLHAAAVASQHEFKRRIEAALSDMTGTVEREMGGAVGAVESGTAEMTDAAAQMQRSSVTLLDNARSVTAVAEQSLDNTQQVAAAIEELSAAIAAIGGQVEQSSRVARNAVEDAAATEDVVRGLADAAEKIGKIVDLISAIARQTNLLARNATIEAARAGEAGRGFAVVAAEVKGLANQTAHSSNDIRDQVAAIQSTATSAVTAIKRISETINRMNGTTSSIAASIGQQTAVNAEIARRVQDTADGARVVAARTQDVTDEAERVGRLSSSVGTASTALRDQIKTLRNTLVRIVSDSSLGDSAA